MNDFEREYFERLYETIHGARRGPRRRSRSTAGAAMPRSVRFTSPRCPHCNAYAVEIVHKIELGVPIVINPLMGKFYERPNADLRFIHPSAERVRPIEPDGDGSRLLRCGIGHTWSARVLTEVAALEKRD